MDGMELELELEAEHSRFLIRNTLARGLNPPSAILRSLAMLRPSIVINDPIIPTSALPCPALLCSAHRAAPYYTVTILVLGLAASQIPIQLSRVRGSVCSLARA